MTKKQSVSPLARLTRTMERGFAAAKEDIEEIRRDMATKDDIKRLEMSIAVVDAKVGKVDSKLDAFEKREVDKRLQLEVRVTRIEKKVAV